MHKYILPEPERPGVHDLAGLVTRKVMDRAVAIPKKPDQSTHAFADRADLRLPLTVSRALEAFDGRMLFDRWLNHPDTQWSLVRHVSRVLSGNQAHSFQYMELSGFGPSLSTAGLLSGKIAAMEAACLTREIYASINLTHTINNPKDQVHDLLRRLGRFINLPVGEPELFKIIITTLPDCNSLHEFEARLLARFMPVNNVVRAQKIFKSRMQKTLWLETAARLWRTGWDIEFEMYYILGIASRLNGFDFRHPFWNRTTLNPLRQLLLLCRIMAKTDFVFARSVLLQVVPAFLSKQSFHSEQFFAKYVRWFIYRSAHDDRDLMEVVTELSNWEINCGLRISFRPRSLYMVYRALPYYDLEWACRELEDVIVVEKIK